MTVAGGRAGTEAGEGRGQLVLAISTSNSNWLASLSKSLPSCHLWWREAMAEKEGVEMLRKLSLAR